MKKFPKLFTLFISGCFISLFILFPQEGKKAALEGLLLSFQHIFPSLFPLLLCMLMFVSRLPPSPAFTLLSGFLMGSPGSGKLCRTLSPSPGEARFLALFTGTLSPMFFLSMLPGVPFALRFPLFFCHILGAWVLGFLYGKPSFSSRTASKKQLPVSFLQAVLQSAQVLLLITACVMLGKSFTTLLFKICPFLSEKTRLFLSVLAEATSGLNLLSESKLSPFLKTLLIEMAASFGGISLLLQNSALWKNQGVSPFFLFWGRICHALLSGFFWVMYAFFNKALPYV